MPADQTPSHSEREVYAAPYAEVRGRHVWRWKPAGALDWVTVHLTKWGARRAAARYLRDGKVKGLRV